MQRYHLYELTSGSVFGEEDMLVSRGEERDGINNAGKAESDNG